MRLIRNINSNVNPSDDAKLFNKIFSDGIFNSPEITSLGANQVNIPSLYGILQGRDFTTENTNINVKLPVSDSTKGYIVLKINLANIENPLTFETYLDPYNPTNQDINSTGTISEMILAEYQCSAVNVTSISNVYPKAISIESPAKEIVLQASAWDTSNKTIRIPDLRILKTPFETKQEFKPIEAKRMTDEQLQALRDADIVDYETVNGAAILKANGKIPSIDIPIIVIFRGVK